MRGPALFEALLMVALIGCQAPRRSEKPLPPPAARRASPFECRRDVCRQAQPRLPDAGEWRCADRAGVVWCAGGEPAAGIVNGPPDPRYRCGSRWGESAERVCFDGAPDYPDAKAYECAFEQELGVARVCKPNARAAARPFPAADAVPACWLDSDCPSRACERGACACHTDQDCTIGRCVRGVCAGGKS